MNITLPHPTDLPKTATISRPEALAEVADVRRRLAAVLGPIERIFLGAGEHLGAAVGALGSVTKAFDLLSETVESDTLRTATGALLGIPDALAAAATGNSQTSGALRRLDELAGGLSPPLARLRKTVHEVQVLEVNARIEVGQVTMAGTDFSVFTRDMGRLVSQAMTELDHLAAELASLVHDTATARASQEAVDHQHGTALAEVVRRLRAGAATMAERRRDAAEAARATRDAAQDNAQRLAQAIGALQIGDIARQRIEHVDEALATFDDGEDEPRLGPICRLQALQLGQTHHELAREVASANASITSLMDEAVTMRRQGSQRFAATESGGRSFLHQLATDLAVALDLVTGYRDAGLTLQKRLEPVTATVADMVARIAAVHSIEADMRIMGLNATLKCGRLGSSGRALGIIAQELRAHAAHTAEDAAKVMAGLEEISAVARSLSHGDEASGGDAGDVAATLRDVVTAFGHGGEALGSALDLLAHKSESAAAHLAQARDMLAPEAEMLTVLAHSVGALDRLANALGTPDDHASWADTLADSYTMASERNVHAQFTGAGGSSATAAAQVVNVDDFLL